MIIQTKYAYHAIFTSDGQPLPVPSAECSIRFPDIRGAISCGDNFDDGERMAQDCLALVLIGKLEDGLPIPEPSEPETFRLAPNESLHLIEVDLRDFYAQEIRDLENAIEEELVEA